MPRLNFGVFLPFYAFRTEVTAASIFSRLKSVVLECERMGYSSVWLDDHLMFNHAPLLECWTTLSALSSVTERIRLGTMVTPAGFRNPALLAKMAATLDVISGGRLELGIGAGAQKQEHVAYGFSFPETHARAERMGEAVEIIKKLWSQDSVNYSGRHYHVTGAVCEPKPPQKPHPPITIGGCGENHLLKITAQHADRFDFGYLPSFDAYKHKLQVLQRHCEAVGRDFQEIEKSCWPSAQTVLAEDKQRLEAKVRQLKTEGVSRDDFEKTSFVCIPTEFRALLKPYLDLGVTHFMLFFGELPDLGGLRLFAEEVAAKL
ncbi:MAG: TIGR03560 family F420-dependent LLM class oxidoreductase [Candidatus Bathyarchaeia archaeon]